MCAHCGRGDACMDCTRPRDTVLSRNRSAASYDETMKSWLALYKYRGAEEMRKVLGTMLLHAFHLHRQADELESGGLGVAGARRSGQRQQVRELLSYVPLSEERLSERGFNQAAQLAEQLSVLTKLPVVPLLVRARHTAKQSFKARSERVDDLKEVFRLHLEGARALQAACRSGNVRIYMIDDVYTTGTTMNECARAIVSFFPVKVYGITLAR